MAERRPRVLIEHPNSLALLDHAEHFRAAGFSVSVCPGPGHMRPSHCPLLAGDPCSLITRADVVVNGLGTTQLRVYLATRVLHPDTPVAILVEEHRQADLRLALDRVVAAAPMTGGGDLVRLAQQLVDEQDPPLSG
jgi:hypothetical protein